jgi:hypothetical protein
MGNTLHSRHGCSAISRIRNGKGSETEGDLAGLLFGLTAKINMIVSPLYSDRIGFLGFEIRSLDSKESRIL